MNKYKIEFLVGLFFLISIICIIIIVTQITDVKSIYPKEKTYKINALFKNIGNLKKKAKVTINGVKIGNVNTIELIKKDDEFYAKVELNINKNFQNIPNDSSLNILMTGILGEHYIQIEIGNEESFLKDGDTTILTSQALILEDLISKFAFNK